MGLVVFLCGISPSSVRISRNVHPARGWRGARQASNACMWRRGPRTKRHCHNARARRSKQTPSDHLVRRCIRMRVPKAPRINMIAARARTRMQDICWMAWRPNEPSALLTRINALLATSTRTCCSNQDDGTHAERTYSGAQAGGWWKLIRNTNDGRRTQLPRMIQHAANPDLRPPRPDTQCWRPNG